MKIVTCRWGPIFSFFLFEVLLLPAWAWTPGTNSPNALQGFVVNSSNRTDVLAFHNTIYNASEGYVARMAWTGNVQSGPVGTTSAEFKSDVLRRINYYRALTGLPADIFFNDTKSAKCQESALMFSAMSSISHTPPSGWTHYTANAAEAAGNSNIAYGSYGPGSVDAYIRDDGASNYSVGHRRWLLYSLAQEMGTGDVPPSGSKPSANAIWVIGNFKASAPKSFLAWPNKGFVPQNLVPARWSISYPGADFGSATISMTRNGSSVPVSVISRTNNGYGENTLVWEPSGLLAPGLQDVPYNITVSNISGTNVPSTYSYTVTTFNPQVLGDWVNISGPAIVSISGQNYSFNSIAQADQFLLRVSAFNLDSWIEGAETTASVIDGTASDYDLTQDTVKRSGSFAFHLTFPSFAAGDQGVEVDREIIPSSSSQLVFYDLFRFATSGSRLSAEVSEDNGSTWAEVWARSGNGSAYSSGWDASFNARSVSLAAYAGKTLRIRFVYRFSGSTFIGADTGRGVFLDDISVTNASELVNTTETSISGSLSSFTLNSSTAGSSLVAGTSYCLRIRPNVGTKWFGDGPLKIVTAQLVSPTPTINMLPTASGITYGQALANATLSGGSASVAGMFAFTSPSTIPSAGTTSQAVTFTPSDLGNYTTASANMSVTVSKAASVLTWSNPASITYGTALSGTQLNAASSVNGTFSYTPVSGTVLGAGNQTLSALFTPSDSGNYTTVTGNVTVVVNKALSSITTLPTATAISFGQALSSSTLSGGAGNVAGTFAFATPTVVPAVGSSASSVVFTPSDSGNYTTATGNVPVVVNKAPSSITTLPTATAISFGQALSSSTLSGGAGNIAGTFAFATPTVVPAVGSSASSVVFTPSDSGNYTTATGNVTVVVNKAPSSITTLPTATAISFGQALSSSTLSGGAGNVAGTFAFATPTVVPAVGSSASSVVFTPSDSGNYTTATGNVTVVVNKAPSSITTLPTATAISFGQALSSSTLSGGAGNVAGTFAFATPTVVPAVGSSARSVVFTPSDSGNYTTATGNVPVVVNKAPSSITTLPTATAISFGQALSSSTLSGGAGNIAGTFAFATPTVVPAVGSSASSVVFTPSDSGNYTTATGNVPVVVNKALSSITTLPTATAISFGQALSSSTLSGGAGNVAGTFAFATPTVVPAVGSSARGVVFTPTDSGNYTTATGNVTVVVNKAPSSITTLPTATAISFGQALSSSTLSGGAGNVAGTFAFATPTVVPAVGSSARSVVFTPSDSGNYTTATGNVTVLVNKAAQTIGAFATISTKAYGNAPFVIVPPAATSSLHVALSVKSGNATISANNTVTMTGIGTVILAANQPGNSNYNAAPEVRTSFNVTRPMSNLTILTPAPSDGSVTPGFAGITQREVSANYTVSAIPASGMLFKEWRKNNTRLTTNATLKFTMEPNLTLTPVFAIDFAKLAGLYNGLVGTGEIGTGSSPDMQSFPVKNGFVDFNLTGAGVVGGNLSIEGQRSPFKGNFSSNKTISLSVVRANKTAAPATLQLIAALPGEISGNITVSGNKLPFRALRAAYSANATAHALGNRTYTLAIPAPAGVSVGHGFASVSIQGNGVATVVGKLATGDAISASAGIVDSGDGNWVLPLYSTGNSVVTGEIVIPKSPSAGTAEVAGIVEWLRKPNASTALFPTGFLKRSTIVGSKYSVVTGKSFLSGNATTANFTLGIDPLKKVLPAVISQKGSWSSSNVPAFTQPITSGLIMSFIPANGNIQGTFNRTVNRAPVSTAFQGVMFASPLSFATGQPMIRGAGYFLSGNQTVPVQITVP